MNLTSHTLKTELGFCFDENFSKAYLVLDANKKVFGFAKYMQMLNGYRLNLYNNRNNLYIEHLKLNHIVDTLKGVCQQLVKIDSLEYEAYMICDFQGFEYLEQIHAVKNDLEKLCKHARDIKYFYEQLITQLSIAQDADVLPHTLDDSMIEDV